MAKDDKEGKLTGQDRAAQARSQAQERRVEQGKEPKAFGPGGNPDKSDEVEDVEDVEDVETGEDGATDEEE